MESRSNVWSRGGEKLLKRFAYIDALRGYACLLVIAVHTGTYFDNLPWALQTVVEQGARGVQLFFIASAITLCMAWESRNDGLSNFYMRRLFRIAPMFWFAMVYFTIVGIPGQQQSGPAMIAASATFLHGFTPQTITSAVPGGWSIAVEMMFYAIFPFLFVFLRHRSLGTVVVISLITAIACSILNNAALHFAPSTEETIWTTFVSYWLPNQMQFFLAGMLIYRINEHYDVVPATVAKSLVLVALLFCFALPFVPGSFKLYTFAFAALIIGLRHWQPIVLVNPIIVAIGKVSYSGYLVHFAMIYAISRMEPFSSSSANFVFMFALISTATIAVSTVTYRLVEKPMIAAGNRICERLHARHSFI